MKRFAKYILSIVGLLIVVFIPLELWVRSLDNSYKTKNRYIKEHGAEIETLVLGSSHSYYGINPEYLDDKSFNIANVSQGLYYDKELIMHYSANLTSLNTIVCVMSFTSLFSNPNIDSYSVYYQLYMGLKKHSSLSKYNFEFCWPTSFSVKLLSSISGINRNCSNLGWGPDYSLTSKSPKNREIITYKDRADSHSIKDWKYLDGNIKTLCEIAEYCSRNKIRLVLVTTPVYHKYAESLYHKQIDKTLEVIDSLSNQYSLTYLNYFQDDRISTSECFYDSDHLSDVGAEKFTKILNEDLKYNKGN